MAANLEDQLRQANQRAGKTYAFDRTADHNRPHEYFFQESHEGTVLFVIFYTLACRWNLCTGCNLPSISSPEHISFRALMRQVDFIFAQEDVRARGKDIRKVILSNNGSMLDEETFSSTALIYLVARCNLELPALRTLTLETRIEYVDFAELEFLARALAEGESRPKLELAVGFEAFDDTIRNKHFLKGLTLNRFEEFVAKIAPFGFHLKCYFMQKCVPEMDDEQAVSDIHHAIDYLASMAEKHKVVINMHLNPTYAARGTRLAEALEQGVYTPPLLRDVVRAVVHARGKPISLFVGLSDEGLAVEGGSFLRPGDDPFVEALEAFNRTQDTAPLEALLAEARP